MDGEWRDAGHSGRLFRQSVDEEVEVRAPSYAVTKPKLDWTEKFQSDDAGVSGASLLRAERRVFKIRGSC